MNTIIYLLLFLSAILIYAAITSRINQKSKCAHDWDDLDEGVTRCHKCLKPILRTKVE